MRRVGAVLLLKPILSLALTMHHIASRRVVRAAARAAGPRKAAREPCVVEDVEGLCGAYDTILLDQFGVVHDGKVPYDGAPELVRRLQRAGKRVVVLSNSSKRRRDTIERLEAMGCGAGTLRDRADTPDGRPAISAVTSGDLVHDALAARARGAPAPLLDGVAGPAGRDLRAFVFGNGDDDEAYLVSCGVAPARVEEADCLLARGLFATLPGGPLAWDADDACDDVLAAAAARGLPLVVANPDLVRPDGRASPMPGRLMARYVTRFGGAAHPVGKPYPYIYEEALRRCAPAGRVLAVGDSMAHDVAGANRAGVDSALVCWGIHAADVGVAPGSAAVPLDAARLAAFLAAFEPRDRPTFVLPAFRV